MSKLIATLSLVVVLACQRDSTSPRTAVDLVASAPAAGSTSETPFVAFAFTCPGDASQVLDARKTGNMLHLELLNTGTVVSDNPLLAGRVVVRVSVNVNLRDPAAPAGNFAGSLVVSPAAMAGTWEGSFGGHLNGGRLEGDPLTPVDAHIVADGKGAFEGMKIKFDHQINPAFDAPPAPPGCTTGGERWIGIIQNPAG